MKKPVRALFFLLLTAGTLFLSQWEEVRGRLQAWDRLYVNQLTNLIGAPPEPTGVSLLRVRPQDLESGDLEPRLDWAIVMNSLLKFEPPSAGIVPPLRWDEPDVLTEGALAKQVKRMPEMALGTILSPSASGAADKASLDTFLTLERISGNLDELPQAKGVAAMPDEELLLNGKPGFTHIELTDPAVTADPSGVSVPLLAVLDDRVVPSFALQLVMLHHELLPNDIVADLDAPRPRLHIGDEFSVPVDASGHLAVHPSLLESVPQIDFASLALAVSPFQEVAEELRKATREELETLRTHAVIIGFDDQELRQLPLPDGENVSRAQLLSLAAASIETGYHVTPWTPLVTYGAWGGLALLGVLVLSTRRCLALGAAPLLAALFLGFSCFMFRQELSWSPPWGALVVCLFVALLSFTLPRKRKPKYT